MPQYNPLDKNFTERRRNKYAVVLYLPQSVENIILPIRERYDPLNSMVSAHITLVFPFETNQSMDDISHIIKKETDLQSPLAIELDSIGDFYPSSPVIYWNVKRNNELNELYYRLYSGLEVPIPFKNYIPHVAIAREISNHRVILVKEEIISYLPYEKFHAASIDLVTPLVNGKWVSVRTFTLSG